jgi:CD36 family
MPEQGIPLEVAIRLQINILVRPLDFIDILQGIPTMFYPMIWFETTTELPEDMAAQLRLLSIVPKFGIIFGSVGLGIGALLLATGFFMFRRSRTLVV